MVCLGSKKLNIQLKRTKKQKEHTQKGEFCSEWKANIANTQEIDWHTNRKKRSKVTINTNGLIYEEKKMSLIAFDFASFYRIFFFICVFINNSLTKNFFLVLLE